MIVHEYSCTINHVKIEVSIRKRNKMVNQNDNTNENIEALKNAIHNISSTSKHSFKDAHEDNKETFTRAKEHLHDDRNENRLDTEEVVDVLKESIASVADSFREVKGDVKNTLEDNQDDLRTAVQYMKDNPQDARNVAHEYAEHLMKNHIGNRDDAQEDSRTGVRTDTQEDSTIKDTASSYADAIRTNLGKNVAALAAVLALAALVQKRKKK